VVWQESEYIGVFDTVCSVLFITRSFVSFSLSFFRSVCLSLSRAFFKRRRGIRGGAKKVKKRKEPE